MTQSVLGRLTLGYRPLWNKTRRLAGIELFVHEDEGGCDGAHLLRTLGESCTADSVPLVLRIESCALLASVLDAADGNAPSIEIPQTLLADRALRCRAKAARSRGARLIASGEVRQAPDAEAATWFERRGLLLSADDAIAALTAAARMRQTVSAGYLATRASDSPVQSGALVDGVASRALAEHVLDGQGAWAVSGWPVEDVLQRYRGQPMPASNKSILRVMNALDAELSLDRIEQLVGEEPTLAYRLLLYANSAGLGLASGIASLRHTFMMLGFNKLKSWLAEQLPNATEDPNLQPVNVAMVLRGGLMEHLMDAGVDDDLRREIFLCGLFAQLDLVLDEPLRTGLARIPVSDRIVSAIVSHEGPYAAALEITLALENPDPTPLRALRIDHEMDAESVNRALLRALAAQMA